MSLKDERASARLRVVRGSDAPAPSAGHESGQGQGQGQVWSRDAVVVDPTDLDALYRAHASYVAAVAMRLLGRDDELDDLVQDVFLEALRGIARLREPLAVKGWLAKVTVRLSIRRLRKRRVVQALRLELAHDEYEQLLTGGASPEQRALVAKIYRVLDALPARTRVIWILRHVLEQPLHAIVELTASSQSTVQRKLRDAERVLEKELHDE